MTDPAGPDGPPFVKELPERFNELGSFIREQRSSARLSMWWPPWSNSPRPGMASRESSRIRALLRRNISAALMQTL